MIKLGQKVKDKVTGFSGVVVSYSKHLAGCDRVWIAPPVDKDGKYVDGAWFDITNLEGLEQVIEPTIASGDMKPGGPVSRKK